MTRYTPATSPPPPLPQATSTVKTPAAGATGAATQSPTLSAATSVSSYVPAVPITAEPSVAKTTSTSTTKAASSGSTISILTGGQSKSKESLLGTVPGVK